MSSSGEVPHLIELDTAQCWELLAHHRVGRIGFIVDGEPVVVPVNYVVDGESLVFRTSEEGSIATAGKAVAFQVDELNEASRSGWSVLVRGRTREVTDAEEIEALQNMLLAPWVPGRRTLHVRVLPRVVTGRRLTHGLDATSLWLG